jgi:hypothetical protein
MPTSSDSDLKSISAIEHATASLQWPLAGQPFHDVSFECVVDDLVALVGDGSREADFAELAPEIQ